MEIELKKRESALESRMTALIEKEAQLNKRAERMVQVFFLTKKSFFSDML
jgi:hypothetical protein